MDANPGNRALSPTLLLARTPHHRLWDDPSLGGALVNAGRPAEAIGPSKTALRLNPGLVEARLNLGNTLLGLGKPQEAIAAYRQVLALRPDFAAAHHNLAAALHALGQDDEARAELQRAH